MRGVAVALIVAASLATSAGAEFQQRRGGGGRFGRGMGAIENPNYDGAFMFCRIMFRNASDGDGGGWSVDWPRADENLSFRFSELTRTSVSRDAVGKYNHVVIPLTDEARLTALVKQSKAKEPTSGFIGLSILKCKLFSIGTQK
jgi:hypothetical protein